MTPLSFTIPGQASRAGLALLTSVFCVGLARPLLSSATAGQEGRAGTVRSGAVELEGSDTVANDDFGWSVALAARTVVVGAPAHAASAGRAYVFVEEATGWRQAAELVGSDTVAGDEFGYSVAISQDTVVVGSIGPPSGPGRAYVFSGSTGRWRQTAEFQGPSGFGRGVAICGDNVVVGSPRGGPTLAAEPGRAFLFSRSASGWHKAAELMPANGAPGDGFGASVAIGGGNTVLVGSPDYRSGVGRAYVFARSGPGWHQTAELGSPKTAPLELFGESASVSGGTIVVGAAGPPEGPAARTSLGSPPRRGERVPSSRGSVAPQVIPSGSRSGWRAAAPSSGPVPGRRSRPGLRVLGVRFGVAPGCRARGTGRRRRGHFRDICRGFADTGRRRRARRPREHRWSVCVPCGARRASVR